MLSLNKRAGIRASCPKLHWVGRLGNMFEIRLHEFESHCFNSLFQLLVQGRNLFILFFWQWLKFVVYNYLLREHQVDSHAFCRVEVFNCLGMSVSSSWTVNGCLNSQMPFLSFQQISTVQDVQILRRSIWGSPVETSTWITSSMYF